MRRISINSIVLIGLVLSVLMLGVLMLSVLTAINNIQFHDLKDPGGLPIVHPASPPLAPSATTSQQRFDSQPGVNVIKLFTAVSYDFS
jgi:hypothetical protein